MKIALDAMGGDLAPQAAVEGAILATRELGVELILVGDRDIIAHEVARHAGVGLPITIEHAAETIAMDDSPLESVIAKPNSSINRGFELVRGGAADSFVSAGNSGAMMAAAMLILGTVPGVDRPAIASLIPSASGFTLLIDAGANTEVKPVNLVQFAVMGSVYARRVRHVARPRVGILSNGEEDSKGTDLTRAAAALLRWLSADIDYIGYVEGSDINRGRVDVVVTDGFTGNVALKSLEGFSSFLLGNLRELFSGTLRGRLAYLLIGKYMSAMRQRLDPSEYGGAPLLGVNGVAIIAHGSSNPRAIRNAVRAAADEALVHRVNTEITEVLARSTIGAAPAKQGGKGLRGILARMRDKLHLHHREGELPRHNESEPPKAEQYKKGADGIPPAADDKHSRRELPPLHGPPIASSPPSSNGASQDPDQRIDSHVKGAPHAGDSEAPRDNAHPAKDEPSA